MGEEEEVVVGMESDAASGRSMVVCSIVDASMAASEQRIKVQRRGRKRRRRRLEVWVRNIFWIASGLWLNEEGFGRFGRARGLVCWCSVGHFELSTREGATR